MIDFSSMVSSEDVEAVLESDREQIKGDLAHYGPLWKKFIFWFKGLLSKN